jgi:hypothetical protein
MENNLHKIPEFTEMVIRTIEENDSEKFSKDFVIYLLNEIKKNELLRIEMI